MSLEDELLYESNSKPGLTISLYNKGGFEEKVEMKYLPISSPEQIGDEFVNGILGEWRDFKINYSDEIALGTIDLKPDTYRIHVIYNFKEYNKIITIDKPKSLELFVNSRDLSEKKIINTNKNITKRKTRKKKSKSNYNLELGKKYAMKYSVGGVIASGIFSIITTPFARNMGLIEYPGNYMILNASIFGGIGTALGYLMGFSKE
ncbi:hypothetical protein KY334_07735 [Candidatus Woesearchaeota archaeon]|nr:hypothetical protein [Candidatus Woesearchaeota archaeon]